MHEMIGPKLAERMGVELRERAAEWLSLDRALVYEAAPTLTYRVLGWLLVLVTAAGVVGPWGMALRRRARKAAEAPPEPERDETLQ